MKIERIILFTKGIETLSFFSEQLGKTFSKLGYEVFYFDPVSYTHLDVYKRQVYYGY